MSKPEVWTIASDTLHFLSPDITLTSTFKKSDSNNYSVVFQLKHENETFLFTGDMEAPLEKALVDKYCSSSLPLLPPPKAGKQGRSPASPSYQEGVKGELPSSVKSTTATPPNPAYRTGRLPLARGGGTIILTNDDIKEALNRSTLVFDKKGEEFYNVISALHKSMRGSDASAALYWLARMLEGGVDPLYVARRVLRFAAEDIGMANSEAMIQANAAYDACHKIGMPECTVHLAQAVVYCAKAAKSNLLYRAYQAAAKDAQATSHLGVPLHLRNAPTKLMKELDYGKNYQYNPEYDEPVIQDYLPPELKGKNYLVK
jgi:hypothetical protein